MMIDIAQAERWDELTGVLSQYPSYLSTYGTPADKAVAYLMAQLQAIGRKEAGWVLGAPRRGGIAGIGAREASAWDSRIYQVAMAKIAILMALGSYAEQMSVYRELLNQLLAGAGARGFQHLTCRVDTRDLAQVHSLQAAGFILVDTTIDCLWTPARLTPEPAAAWVIRPYQESDIRPMEELTRLAFPDEVQTRYGADPGLPTERTRELYAQWFLESCRGRFADIVLVAELEGKPIAYQTAKADEDFAQKTGVALAGFGIGAVASEQRGKQVLPSMLRAVVRWGAARGIGLCHGRALIHNVSMLKAILRSGAAPGTGFYTFHKWLG